MEKLCLFFVLAVLSSGVLGLSFRNKRQAEKQEDLDDRYGWNIPNWQNRPGNGRFPQFPIDQFFGQNPGSIFDQFPGQQINPTAPTPVANSVTTQSTSVQDCIRTCPVTSEYNPVCGSDNVTYENPGRLACARACGITVNLLRSSRCPPTTVAPTS